MMEIIQSIVFSKVLICYALVFASIAAIKKYNRIRFILNNIWFSADGSVPPNVIKHLTSQVKVLQRFNNRLNANLYFWTDTQKLKPDVRRLLKRAGVTIKDYKSVFRNDEISIKIKKQLYELLEIRHPLQKVAYVMGSDIFRMYLMFNALPKRHPSATFCYIDCTDIDLTNIIDPSVLGNQCALALRKLSFQKKPILDVIACPQESIPVFSNDVILTGNYKQNKHILNEVFNAYYQNLNHLDQLTHDFVEFFKETLRSGVDDYTTILAIVFGTTNIMSTLVMSRLRDIDAFIIKYGDDKPEIKSLDDIQDAADFIDYVDKRKQGSTWVPVSELGAQNSTRDRWYEILRQRYQVVDHELSSRLKDRIHPNGFWLGNESVKHHQVDIPLAMGLVDFFKKEKIKLVADFGCGKGSYVKALQRSGIESVGYDGHPESSILFGDHVKTLDLSQPIDLQQKFDWVISLEVGEHIPKQFEHQFLNNLHHHNTQGIILSWAVKGQGGFGHVNEQDNDYIKKIMKTYDYYNDVVVERNLRWCSELPWFKDTIMVFRKRVQKECL